MSQWFKTQMQLAVENGEDTTAFYATVTTIWGSKTRALKLSSQLEASIEGKTQNIQLLCVNGAPAVAQGYYDGLLFYAKTLCQNFKGINDTGETPEAATQHAIDLLAMVCSVVPTDPSGRREAGVIAQNMGSLPYSNGVVDLTGFPLAPAA